MAVLRRRTDRGNRYEVDYRDIDGKRYRVDCMTTDKKIANLWLKKVEELISQAKLGLRPKVGRIDVNTLSGKEPAKPKEKPGMTLTAFQQKYEDRARHDLELAQATIENNNCAFKSFIGVVGDKLLADLTDGDIVGWKKELLEQGKSRTTVAIYFRHLRAAFARAAKWKDIPANPFLLVEDIKEKRTKGKEKDLSLEEVQRLLNAVDVAEDYTFGTYIRFLLYTGCRRNEILFLKWEDIDLEQRKLHIYADKTDRDLEIPINKALLRVIDEMEMKESGYVFQTQSASHGARKKKQPWHQDYPSRHFKAYIRALGMSERYSLHSLRHTYGNALLQKGVSLDIVQKLLGHSSVRTTADNYDHTIALHFREQADLVDFEG